MSGSGGFYKYRCKNFYSHNCPNWVWVNNSPCATCIVNAEEQQLLPSAVMSHGIAAPRIQQDILQHAITNLMAPNESGESCLPDDEANGVGRDNQPPQDMTMTCSYRTVAGWQ
ncbi:hypothetical protein M419DRAFT_80537 [Trichoderma reesei RUT C-30]|uniref:Uncharacterized protein n=1 Tax=Hypocrea jecorina (strain ATCC 56765 / BCRC 32924 / NRRL 11460 / Rut C-30) TaxID=1344414 RepID=A0A024S855_HYPJR|nr:hypothetical protein M419DRAFT_80537 [Trichoderma reesei RUT C-30]